MKHLKWNTKRKRERNMAKTQIHPDGAMLSTEQLDEAQNTDPANDSATAPVRDAEDGPELELSAQTQISQADYDRVTEERDRLLDRLARLQAEFDNARKREARERAEFRDYATAEAIKPLLPALDHFHLALDAKGSPEQLRSGVEMIVKQMEDALRSLGIVPVESVGVAFNPHVHEGLGHVETTDVPDEHVAEEIRRGYKLKDRLLRPASVRVATNKQKEA
jgi:molecular chaperone GrpE